MPVPETEAPDAGKTEEQSDARDANLNETADLEEDEEVKVQDAQDVQEVEEVEEAPEVEEAQECQGSAKNAGSGTCDRGSGADCRTETGSKVRSDRCCHGQGC